MLTKASPREPVQTWAFILFNPAREKIKKEVFELISQKYPDNNVAIDASAIVIAAEK